MKNFTFLAFFTLLSLISLELAAQKQPPQIKTTKEEPQGHLDRCGTMEAIQKNLDANPQYRAQYEAAQRAWEQSQTNRTGDAQRTDALTGPVTIPVVVHIVLPNPFIVTDADVQYFINRLNLDFSGLNPDSANGTNWFSVRGHSLLRFVLARRSPAGILTNGIERKVGNIQIGTATYQPIKHVSDGGLDPWNVTQYYNLWVGQSGNLLGIAPAIGVGNQTETTTSTVGIDGVCVNYQGFANNSCYTSTAYNLARTAVHEIGHNFGLFHTFQGGCANADFQQLTTPTQLLPDPLLAPSDDTPGQSASTAGCPTGSAATGCAAFPTPPGKMYQNYMDYTDDACYSMFTNGQVARMHYVLENFRPGYLTTQGYLPPTGAILLDAAAFESVNPGGYELVGCTVVNYPATVNCPGSFSPRFRIKNNGANVITSVTAGYRLNNGAPAQVTITGLNLPTGAEYVVTTLPPATLIDGPNVFKFYTSQPNGSADQNIANDTLTTTLNITAAPLPVLETFESTTFPPPGWTVVSVNTIGTVNWTRNTPGKNSTGALYINNYLNSTDAIDDFRSSQFAANPTDVVTVSFDVAYHHYSLTTSQDTLAVLISGNCGTTFSTVYKKWGVNLSTGALTTGSYTPASAADWRTETIAVPAALLATGKFQVIFRSTSRFGNNIWIDNINVVKKYNRDLKVERIVSPIGNVCTNTISPQVQITNNGIETINSFTLAYTTNTGASGSVNVATPLAPGAVTTVTLPNGTVPLGVQTFTATATNVVFASGLPDDDLTNNTLAGTFTVVTLNSSITQGFEVTPVAGWTVNNPDGDNTWGVVSPGKNSLRSAFINNYDFPVFGRIDDLRSPFLRTSGIDSLIITFDLAHKNFTGSNDNLSVLAVTGCGTVFTPTGYSKSGAVLATAGASGASYLNPAANDWRTERISIGSSVLGTSGNALIAWRNTNDYGNNIFIDNVNIIPLYKRDLQVVSINGPSAITCSGNITPSVTVKNNGTETIIGYKVGYNIDNGPAQTATVVTGVSIPRNSTATINLTAVTVPVGVHVIKVYSFEPITASGTGDQNTVNDTLTKSFNILPTVPAPLSESFVSTTFPPTNWTVLNPDGGITWRRYAQGNGNAGSAYVNTFNYPANGQKDDLLTPFLSYNGVDSVNLAFDVAAVTFNYPGSTEIPIDTLEVLITRDCGNTFTSIYKRWGAELQTVNAPNDPQTTEFFPNFSANWRKESIDLTQYAANSPVSVMFRVTNNYENNIFIDNVNFSTRTLPALLKQQGYLILPSPFTNSFTVWHYNTPSTVKYMSVYNAAGQMVYYRQFNGNADKQVQIDLTGKAAGVYVVEVGYMDGNRNVRQKVVKY